METTEGEKRLPPHGEKSWAVGGRLNGRPWEVLMATVMALALRPALAEIVGERPPVGGADHLAAVDALEINAGDAEVGVPSSAAAAWCSCLRAADASQHRPEVGP
jgi:hypothetical protein